jgi:voltage-gated potassium channel
MDARSEQMAKRFERPLLVAAVLTIPVTILQLSTPPQPWTTIADVFNWLIWLAFLAELVAMLMVVPSKAQWLREHPVEVVIVVATPPFLPSLVQSTRTLRLLRLLRFLRLAPLVRALFTVEGLRYAALLALLTARAGGVGFATEENISIGNGIYWAITTMTTVGYGDVTPHTAAGKVIAVFVMLVGIGFASLVIGAAAQQFLRPSIEPSLTAIEADEEDLLAQVRDIVSRLEELQSALEQRRAGR